MSVESGRTQRNRNMSMLKGASMANAIEDAESSFKGPAIEPGLYPAVVVGIQGVTSSFEGKTKSGYRFVFQYEDDEKQRFHIVSKQFDLNLYEKSNFAKMMVAWTGCQNTPQALMAMLDKYGFLDENKIVQWDRFLGKNCALMLKLESSKKDPEKKFVNLESFHAPTKKTGRIDAKPEELPWFIGDVYGGQVDDAMYLEGFTVASKKDKDGKSVDTKKDVPTEKPTEAPKQEEDVELPF